MSSNIGASSGNKSSSSLEGESEEDENRPKKTATVFSKDMKLQQNKEDPEERCSSKLEQIVRPNLLKRNAYKITSGEDYRKILMVEPKDRLDTEPVGRSARQSQREHVSNGNGAQCQLGKESNQSVSSISPDSQQNRLISVGEGSNTQRRHLSRPLMSTSSIQTRPKPLLTGAVSKHSQHSTMSSIGGTDLFWEEVNTFQSNPHTPSLTLSEQGDEDEDEEAGSALLEVRNQSMPSMGLQASITFGERRGSRREKKRIKSVRRRQKRREKLRQSQQQESIQCSVGDQSSSSSSSEDEEALSTKNKERYICAVCLDVYFSPHMCHPCNHIFCEPCLRTLAKNSPSSSSTPCPLCRTTITHVFFQKGAMLSDVEDILVQIDRLKMILNKHQIVQSPSAAVPLGEELNQKARALFPGVYLTRKQHFQKANCAKWPLPSCRKLFRIFGGFQRHSSPIALHQFPHSGGYRLDAMDFDDDSRGWRFDMDPVIIYIYSVNWVIAFFIFCFLCYLFFPSF